MTGDREVLADARAWASRLEGDRHWARSPEICEARTHELRVIQGLLALIEGSPTPVTVTTVERMEERDERVTAFGRFIVDQVRALWPHQETPREVAEYIENALVHNARWKEFVDPTPTTAPDAEAVEPTEVQVEAAWQEYRWGPDYERPGRAASVPVAGGNDPWAGVPGPTEEPAPW